MNIVYYKWRVTHPERGSVEVVAATRYEAITKAARKWGERWTRIARDLTVDKLERAEEVKS